MSQSGSLSGGNSTGSKLVLIQSRTASNSATLDFTTNTNLYSVYFFTFSGIRPATNGANFEMQVSNDGGSTWSASGYQTGWMIVNYDSNIIGNGNSTTLAILSPPISNASVDNTCNGNIYCYNCNQAIKGYMTGSLAYFDSVASKTTIGNIAGLLGAQSINAFRFLMSAGNITSGTITCYGMATS